ncbi:MAG: hypothetical protein WAS51_13790 [Ilumatobacteraceae bacterium]
MFDDQPSDNTTLTDVIASYHDAGFTTDFFAEEPASIRCCACNSVLDAGLLPMHSMRRMEGASDPSDMLAVVATKCPVCSATGTLVLGFGPMASPADAAAMSALQDRRDCAGLPASAAPGEMPDENPTEQDSSQSVSARPTT